MQVMLVEAKGMLEALYAPAAAAGLRCEASE